MIKKVVPIDKVLSEQASSKLAYAKARSAQKQFKALMFLNNSEHLDAHVIEALYDLLVKKSGNNILKVEDVIMLVKSDIEIKAYIKQYSQTQLYKLRDPNFVRKHLVKAGAKGTDIVTEENWAHLVADMIERDDRYLIERGWASNICYWGRAAPTSLEQQTVFSVYEWLADFVYYECNTNQFLSIFFHDKCNALKYKYRFLIEWVCISITLTITATTVDNPVFGTIISSILVLVFRNLMLYAFLCPCLITRHDASCVASCCKPVFMYLSGSVALICVLIAILFTIVGLMVGIRAGVKFLKSFLISLASGYFYGILIDLSFPFNPFVAAREFREGKFKKYKWMCGYCFYYLLAFGCQQLDLARWQLERKSVNEHFANTAEEGNASSNVDANSDANNSGSMEQSSVPQSLNASQSENGNTQQDAQQTQEHPSTGQVYIPASLRV